MKTVYKTVLAHNRIATKNDLSNPKYLLYLLHDSSHRAARTQKGAWRNIMKKFLAIVAATVLAIGMSAGVMADKPDDNGDHGIHGNNPGQGNNNGKNPGKGQGNNNGGHDGHEHKNNNNKDGTKHD